MLLRISAAGRTYKAGGAITTSIIYRYNIRKLILFIIVTELPTYVGVEFSVREALNQLPLLPDRRRVHFEVASNEEFTSHYVIEVYLMESEVDLLEGCGR